MRRVVAFLFGVEILAWALWLGGIVSTALAAPVVFQVVSSRDLAGRVFGGILARLFPLMYACGAALLISGVLRSSIVRRFGRLEIARYGLVAAMLGIALYTGVVVVGEMETIQSSLPGPIETLPIDAGPRARFDVLHKLSERLIGFDAILGLLLLPLLLAHREGPAAGLEARAVAREIAGEAH